MQDSQKISYKYDLMHRNTPKFARTTVTWDTKLMSPITRKKVIKALTDPTFKVGNGDAGKMYYELRKKFNIPNLRAFQEQNRYNEGQTYTYLCLEGATPEIITKANEMLQAEITMRRLAGNQWWGSTEINMGNYNSHWNFREPHDITEIGKLMAEFMESDEPKRRRKDALQFLEDGGVLVFTYNPEDRY